MLISTGLSLLIAVMPKHESIFLFLIGVFTIYMILAGNRALTLKSAIKTKADWKDKSITYSMIFCVMVMLVLAVKAFYKGEGIAILYVFFSVFGSLMTYRDLKAFQKFYSDRRVAIISHIGRMVGAYIASITAFIVAGLQVSNLIVWLMPTLLGTVYIYVHLLKFKKTK